jgi:hypothetical protein
MTYWNYNGAVAMPFMENNGYCCTMSQNFLGYAGPANNAQTIGYRVVLRDPAGECYIHLIFYTFNTSQLRDVLVEPVAFMDYYMSTGFSPGITQPDGQENNIKLGCWVNLPTAFAGLDMFAGTNPDGTLWAHFAVEEKPLVYGHLGIGTIEKYLDFTGGDYLQGQSMSAILASNSNVAGFFPYGVCQFCGGAFAGYHNGFYAPDLDVPNKRDPARLYRSTTDGWDVQYDNRTNFDIERGRTSSTVSTYSASTSGELSINLLPLPNPWTGTSPLFPIFVLAVDGNNRNYSGPVGYFRGIRSVNLANFNPKDEITLGNDVWKVYPVRTKDAALSPRARTVNNGYAVLKNG